MSRPPLRRRSDPWVTCLVVLVSSVALWAIIIGGAWLLAHELVALLH